MKVVSIHSAKFSYDVGDDAQRMIEAVNRDLATDSEWGVKRSVIWLQSSSELPGSRTVLTAIVMEE